MRASLLASALAALLLSCGPGASVDDPVSDTTPVPDSTPLYITLVMHAEDGYTHDFQGELVRDTALPNYLEESQFRFYAGILRLLATRFSQFGAKISFQTDWTFILGADIYDPAIFSDLAAMGHEIDIHSHEYVYKYSEVWDMMDNTGFTPSGVVGGFLVNDNWSNYFGAQQDKFQTLWGGGTEGHEAVMDQRGYVYRPSPTSWKTHEPDQKLVLVGAGAGIVTATADNGRGMVEEAVASVNDDIVNSYTLVATLDEFHPDPGTPGIPEILTADEDDPINWRNRFAKWDEWLSGTATSLSRDGRIEWKTIEEIRDQYLQEEQENPAMEEVLISLSAREAVAY